MKLKRSFLLQDQLNEDGYLPSSTEGGDDLYCIDADVSGEVFPAAENRKDIPGILSLGVKYGATSELDVEFGFNYYQNEQAKWGRDEDGLKTGQFYNNSYEAAFSGEWKQDWGRLSAVISTQLQVSTLKARTISLIRFHRTACSGWSL